MARTNDPQAALTLTNSKGGKAGADKIALLKEVGKCGSISAAAKSAGMSYKTAWDAINFLNNLFPKPLVASKTGGRAGGGAELTAEGHKLIEAYHLLSEELTGFLGRLNDHLGREGAPDSFSVTDLLWKDHMQTSARNTIRGNISAIVKGAVNSEVVLSITEKLDIVAIITNQSVKDMGLEIGKPALALINSASIIVAPDQPELKTSARNALKGPITQLTKGAVNDEITIDLGQGRTLTATVTHESTEALSLDVGNRVSALVKASQVILACA